MSIPKHTKEHAMLGLSVFNDAIGTNVIAVTTAEDLTAKVAEVGTGITLRDTYVNVITKTNGSPIILGVGTDWIVGKRVRVNDLIQFAGDTSYYKVKEVDSDTQLTLYGNYNGATVITTVAQWKTHYMKWTTFLLMAGTYVLDGISVFPGQSFAALDKNTVRISELSALPSTPFVNWSENSMTNLTFTPSETFDTVDGIVIGGNEGWAGMESRIDHCYFNLLSLGGTHGGGATRLPIIVQGKSYISNCLIRMTELGSFEPCYRDGTATIANTEVIMDNVRIEYATDFFTRQGDVQSPVLLWLANILGYETTYNITNLDLVVPEDFNIPVAFLKRFAAIETIGAICEANLNNVKVRAQNTDVGNPCYGVYVGNASTVNLFNCDLEVEGTTPECIHVANAGGVVNVRHSRLKSPSVCIDAGVGTVNYDSHTSIITGANNGTLLDT